MEEDDRTIRVCPQVASWTGPRYPGSVARECAWCGQLVYTAPGRPAYTPLGFPTTREHPDADLVCIPCASNHPEHGPMIRRELAQAAAVFWTAIQEAP
jgi:hypothetical protein